MWDEGLGYLNYGDLLEMNKKEAVYKFHLKKDENLLRAKSIRKLN